MNIDELGISTHILKYYTFFDNIIIEQFDAMNLLINPARFDLIAKYIYILYKAKNLKTKWGEVVYQKHIKAFNNFSEDDGSGKTGENVFVNTFNDLIFFCNEETDLKSSFLIPLDENNCPIDGSHRLALSAYYEKPIDTIRMKGLKPDNSYVFDYAFFLNKGLETKYSDFIALEYAKLNPDTYLLCVFPKAKAENLLTSFENLVCEYVDVYYKKDIYLTNIGQFNTILSLYKDENWLGDALNGFAGAKHKVDMCFGSLSNPLKVYLLSTKSAKKIAQLKLRLRSFFALGNHSLHINDIHEQTIRLAKLFFNDNSIDYINNVSLKKPDKFLLYLSLFNEWVASNSFDKDDFCISGSAVLSAFGLRDCYDLDFLAAEKMAKQACDNQMIVCHNDHFLKYSDDEFISIDDLIFNPTNYFYIDDVKFLTLDILKQFKTARNEYKDLEDISLINSFFKVRVFQRRLKYPIKEHLINNKQITSSSSKNCFTHKIEYLRLYARIEWYKNITESNQYIHPKLPVFLPEYLVDRYSFRLYVHSIISDSMKAVNIPHYDIFTAYDNWYNWISKNFSGLPSYNYTPPSLNSKIAESDFRSLLFYKWYEFIKGFDIDISEECYQDPANLYWFEYFQNSCLFPKKPAMWGPTYFYKLSLKQQQILVDGYGIQGIMDFFIFMQQVHEESHIQQKGEPMLGEFIHAWLWCKFIKEADLEIFQINDETLFSCNIERKWVTSINFTKLEIKKLFEDTYVGSMMYFSHKVAYENICLTAFLFDHKLINYQEYLDIVLNIFMAKNNLQWHENFYQNNFCKINLLFE
ncbi:MAG: hypothetical protein F6K41_27085 [Symploca sp. SIO3E6]|nr:hypothetical protein [Caldora sp. SIO3E6]